MLYICGEINKKNDKRRKNSAYWINLSDEDVSVADDLLISRHYLQTAFFCHLSVEKLFKACYTKLQNDTPPFRHELDVLAQRSGFYELLNEKQQDFYRYFVPV